MGENAEMLLDGTLCEGCGVFLDGESPGHPRNCPLCNPLAGHPRPDLKAERAFERSRPTKNLCCIAPGCAKKFRPTTAYQDFLHHWQDKHGAAPGKVGP